MKAEKVSIVLEPDYVARLIKEQATSCWDEEGLKAIIDWPRLASCLTGRWGPYTEQKMAQTAGLVIDAFVSGGLTVEGPGRDILRQAAIRDPEAAANALVNLLDYRSQQARPLSSGRRDE